MNAVPIMVLPSETRKALVIIEMKPSGDKIDYPFHDQIIVADCIYKQIIKWKNTCYGKQGKNQIVYHIEKDVSRSGPVFFPVLFLINFFCLQVCFFLC